MVRPRPQENNSHLCKMIYFIYQQHGVRKAQLQGTFLLLEPVLGNSVSLFPLQASEARQPLDARQATGSLHSLPAHGKGRSVPRPPHPRGQSPGPFGEGAFSAQQGLEPGIGEPRQLVTPCPVQAEVERAR